MNKANNRITIRLESDLDGSLGVDHGKGFSLSMLISDHIDSHVDAFRSFLLAASFPPKLVNAALRDDSSGCEKTNDLFYAGRQRFVEQSIQEGHKWVDDWNAHARALREAQQQLEAANDMIAELQEANDMLGAGRGVPPGRVPPTNPLSIESLLAECERRESAARGHPADTVIHRDNSVDLYAHDSLLEPVKLDGEKALPVAMACLEAFELVNADLVKPHADASNSLAMPSVMIGDCCLPVCTAQDMLRDGTLPEHVAEALADAIAHTKPPTQTLNVAGIDAVAFGNCGKANGVDAEVAARLNKLVNDPHFQQFAIAFTKTPYETVMDAVKFCVDFVQAKAFRASFSKKEPIKFDSYQYTAMCQAFNDWAKERGITLE